jgi:hypothetical protein
LAVRLATEVLNLKERVFGSGHPLTTEDRLARAVLELAAENARLSAPIPEDAVYRSMSQGKRLVLQLKAALEKRTSERDALADKNAFLQMALDESEHRRQLRETELAALEREAEGLRALAKEFAEAPVQFGFYQDGMFWTHSEPLPKDTHSARLVRRERLDGKKE